MNGLPLAPPEASTFAPSVDALFLFEVIVAGFFCFGIFFSIVYFCIRYRRRSEYEVPPKMPKHYTLELAWTIVPFIFMLIYYFWGAEMYVDMKKPAQNGLEIHVIAKQWMWKIEHPEGVREINALHVPVDVPIKLVLASQDVIHDFYVPAFRMKQDVVPGSFVTEWFEATHTGTYHFFCAQFCGVGHSTMRGLVYVMTQHDYNAWLAGAVPGESAAAAGSHLFTALGCVECHGERAPTLAGLYESTVHLEDGRTMVADEEYLRDAILSPSGQRVAGYAPIMPSFLGQISEEQLYQLIEYIKSLETVRNLPAGNVSQPPAPKLIAPSTRPAPGAQPGSIENFPPAESTWPLPPRQEGQNP
ncbi:MAG TPA: cytochrome c oxidase subunit II [Tepidisphaeraceae bacterium]|nr:cytochrome c oxidase subunit II [Tepidisphaeraceae bacterium]